MTTAASKSKFVIVDWVFAEDRLHAHTQMHVYMVKMDGGGSNKQ